MAVHADAPGDELTRFVRGWFGVKTPDRLSRGGTGFLTAALCALASMSAPASAHADVIAYIVNVTVRPGYYFADADTALAYGYGICDRVRAGIAYEQNIRTVAADLRTDDEYQAAYLINQAVNELCPALIWQLRQSVRI